MNQFARMPRFNGTDQHRRAMIGKVHLAKKEMRLDDDDYRAVLLRVAGKTSAAMLDEMALAQVLDEFRRLGWKARPKSGAADHPSAKKARALWISLHQLGAINDPSERGLEAFARRQLGCERLQWANQSLAYRLIEALKAMAERHGWGQDLAGVAANNTVIVLKRRLVAAICAKLVAAGIMPEDWSPERAAFDFGGIMISSVLIASIEELDLVAQRLGRTLREARP